MLELAERLARLRAQMERHGVDGWIVPHADEYQNETRPAATERLAYVSGFTGSMGTAVILPDQAALFVDSRYILQAPAETDPALFTVVQSPPETVTDWVKKAMKPGAKLGFDPWVHTDEGVAQTTRILEAQGITFAPLPVNLVDEIWAERPALSHSPAVPHPVVFTGEEAAAKRARIAARLVRDGLDGFVMTDPASVAWLLNLRGADVPTVPMALGFGVVQRDATVDLFMEAGKLASPAVRDHLGSDVRIHPPQTFPAFLADLSSTCKLGADMGHAAAGIRVATGGRLTPYPDPCLDGRSRKNAVEVEGARWAHLRDGVALVRFFCWLDARLAAGDAVDELGVMARLLAFRAEGEHFRGVSFETIAGSGPNGAIVHYRSSPSTNRALQAGEFLLLDSGGQYLDGTTDVTRTVAIGAVSEEMRTNFTRVLKGHIAVASSLFPEGTVGGQIDAFARRPLWEAGLDFGHGTGHGVGSYLCVHEGPAQIAPPRSGRKGGLVPLDIGMILSNEPGYYKAGAYGIRTESLMVVVPASPVGAEHPMRTFETLTLCPIDRTVLDPALLTPDEREWLNTYHARVRDALTPHLDPPTSRWLAEATRPV